MAKYCFFNLGCKVSCDKCRKRKHRQGHPLRDAYTALKANSKNRGLPFTLTLVDFTKFCLKTNYLQLKGRYKDSMSIDRIHIVNEDGSPRGYDKDNIQMITKGENNKKQSRDQKEKYSKIKLVVDPDCPF